jgi:hypothetical protein
MLDVLDGTGPTWNCLRYGSRGSVLFRKVINVDKGLDSRDMLTSPLIEESELGGEELAIDGT